MIANREPLSIAESLEYLDKKQESQAEMISFIKNFNELTYKDAKELKKKLRALGILKLREESLIKIIDILPANQEDLNKVLIGVGLDENESKSIFDEIKKFK